ncbi:MAG: HIT family protein [Acidimicrobiales bacterium]
MASVFTRIIDGELPGRFVWRDERCVAFLSINPLAAGHTLVAPRAEIDHWLDLDDELAAHLNLVSRVIGRAQQAAFAPARVALIIAGFEVPHAHLHVIPAASMRQLDFANAELSPAPAALDAAAVRLREALQALGRPEAALEADSSG